MYISKLEIAAHSKNMYIYAPLNSPFHIAANTLVDTYVHICLQFESKLLHIQIRTIYVRTVRGSLQFVAAYISTSVFEANGNRE